MALAICGFAAAVNGQVVTETALTGGEKWFGIFAGGSSGQPFDEPFSIVTGRFTDGSFRTPFAFSASGRYIECGDQARISFDGRTITVTSESRAAVQKGGRTLRQAYLSAHHRDPQTTETYPSRELFTHIVYETEADFGLLNSSSDMIEYARRLLAEGYPAGILVIADGWNAPGDWDFDLRAYGDPPATVDALHRMGFKVMLTVTPYVPAWGRDFALMARDGTLVADGDGKPLLMTDGNGSFAALDMTSPQAAAKLGSALERLQTKYGVDGFRFDCRALVGALSGDYDLVNEYLSAVTAAAAGFPLSEMLPGPPRFQTRCAAALHSPHADMKGYLLDAVTAGLAAGPFLGIIPPGEAEDGDDVPETIRRSLVQMMMPVARVPFAPWRYEAYSGEIARILQFRGSISPYMGRLWDETCKTLEPMVRPLEYLFSKAGFADCTDQYMLGDRYLIAPAMNDSPRRLVRLPRGTWRDAAGKRYKGPMVTEAETGGYGMAWFELQQRF